ncbi:hypothetical protein ACWT_3013 [Actinoplanes sp. SE50]|uniref:hypothetical protein n=1 Tax=unclassified Actinoplanes TaxID=2626549 RepID=UPI00023EBF00|nr:MULTISPECIES: hypothetical protein [unclassified Actinoplanes]AEV84035.1 hypothetical protein ACPL_3140 [Actinoplanes sp. SE50/110]ATO82428.1 hypothetical protein ACWT_3013 [Actinoplanes sp. SE50]SLL99835.1 hypothetical protein ACSP50_3067 [Actinoplanes sp. SE50/110]
MVEWGMLLAPLLVAAVNAAPVCRIADKRMDELSGLVTTADGYVVVNDGSDEASHRRIFYLRKDCSVARAVSYPSRPRDTEDLQLGRDGILWVADIGDNGRSRDTIALWRLTPGSSKPQLLRMSYPDGAHDAEALLITAEGSPIVVTKEPGAAGIYVPDGGLRATGTTRLKRAGDVSVPFTSTSNPFSLAGRLLITGAATSPDGSRVVLRTYADAFEYDVPGGDVVKALVSGTPRQIPLPDEPQGESVAYTTDGTALLTVSEGAKPPILRHPLPDTPATPRSPASSTADQAAPSAAVPPAAAEAVRATPKSSSSRLPLVLLLIAATALCLAAAIAAARRRKR